MSKPMIAVVEDDPAIALLFDELLSDRGYAVRLWPNDSGAFAGVYAARPCLIILDLGLHFRTYSWDLLYRLWSDPSTEHTPVLLCSTAPRAIEGTLPLLRSRRCGALAKPFDPNELLCQVEHLLTSPDPFGTLEGGSTERRLNTLVHRQGDETQWPATHRE